MFTKSIAAALAAVAFTAAPAAADTSVTVPSTVTVRPVVCRPIYCHQTKVIIAYHQGVQFVVTYRHRRPAESRNAYTVPSWSPWWVTRYTATRLS